jgi:hypothetical protein
LSKIDYFKEGTLIRQKIIRQKFFFESEFIWHFKMTHLI